MSWEMGPRIKVFLSLISIQVLIVAASTNSADGKFALNNLLLSVKCFWHGSFPFSIF